jgi:Protein of unknown function (DUF664)
MVESNPKADLKLYLQGARETLIWKLDGLSEYDIRRPLVPTGTNLLGLVKHAATWELVYFGDTFGRPSDESLPWLETDAEPSADMWATADETRDAIIELYRRSWVHSNATIDILSLDEVGRVPHWPDHQNEVTLHRVLLHVMSDTQRHAGHADIMRELIDGKVGLLEGNDNMPSTDHQWWERRRGRLESAALQAKPN